VQRELRAGAHRLPFVALALAAWWRARGDGALDAAGWRALGGVDGALSRHADAALDGMPPEQRALAEEILSRLAATDGAPVVWSDVELFTAVAGAPPAAGRTPSSREDVEAAARALADARLVRWADGRVEIAHEALLASWPRLADVRMAAMERLVFVERLREAAQAWDRSGRALDFLWRGPLVKELAARSAWIAEGLSPVERDFIAETRRSERRRRLGRLGAFAVLGLAVFAVVLGKRAADREQEDQRRRRAEAEGRAYLAEAIAKSRRTEDPFVRAAWIAEAMKEGNAQGSVDGVLPLDLAVAAGDVPRATFLTLDAVSAPAFYWDDRWLVASGSGAVLALVDMRPPEPDVIEDVALDADPEKVKLSRFREPRVTALRPHADPVVQRVPFAFDSSLVTRSVGGEVRAWRLREDGSVALAAIAPMRCRGAVRTADAAPVVACETDDGIARWDLRRMRGERGASESVDVVRFPGHVLDVSADGERIAASYSRRVLLWEPASRREVEVGASRPPVLGRWSPRDRVLALAETARVELWDIDRAEAALLALDAETVPVSLRWDAGGVDVAVCGEGGGRWHYLRTGGRAKDDAAPTDAPCAAPAGGKRRPVPLSTWRDFEAYAERDLGPHALAGGWRLPDGRHLSRDLVLFAAPDPAAASMLRFAGTSSTGEPEPPPKMDSAVAVVRDEGTVAWQIADEVRIYGAGDGRRVMSRKGNLLGRCDDGRLMAWRSEAATLRVFDARSDATIATLPREPALVVGATASCATLYVQRLDGAIVAHDLLGGSAARDIAFADGYVYDARRSVGRGVVPPGMLIAVGSGAIARIDGEGGAVRVLGYATPRATAVGDGPGEGDVAWADATGVVLVRRSGEAVRLLEAQGGAIWEDISIAPDGATMLLASVDRVSVLDVRLRELVGSMPVVLVWSYGRAGGAAGLVLPRGLPLARRVAEAVSNLQVADRRLALRRAP
jgi:hypothetical protein